MRWIDEKSEFMIFFKKKSRFFKKNVKIFFCGPHPTHTSILYHNDFFMHVEHIFSIEMVNFYGCNEYTYQIYPLDVQVLLIEFLWSPKMFIISMDKYPTWTYKKTVINSHTEQRTVFFLFIPEFRCTLITHISRFLTHQNALNLITIRSTKSKSQSQESEWSGHK